MNQRIRAAVLGATGAVGQRFVQLLDNHTWFEVVALTGSDRAVGRPYAQACYWILPQPMPAWARDLVVQPTDPQAVDARCVLLLWPRASLIMPSRPCSRRRAVCSNASRFPRRAGRAAAAAEVKPGHIGLIHRSSRPAAGRGFRHTPTAPATGITITLSAARCLWCAPGVLPSRSRRCRGRGYPGVASLDILTMSSRTFLGKRIRWEWPLQDAGDAGNGAIAPPAWPFPPHQPRRRR